MAVKKAYTTQAKIAAFLGVPLATAGVTDDAINAAASIIEAQTGRTFVADALATERYFDGDGTSILAIDDAVEVTLVRKGNDEWGDFKTAVPAGGTNGYVT